MKNSGIKRGTTPMKRSSIRASKPAANRAGGETMRARSALNPDKRPKRMKHKKIPPNAAEKIWMGLVAKLGCIVCRQQGREYVPCAVHHIVEGNRRLGHMHTIGLCDPGHHQNSPDAEQHSRHPDKARFTEAYGSEYVLLAITRKLLMPFMAEPA